MNYRMDYKQVVDDYQAGRLTYNEAFAKIRGIAKAAREDSDEPNPDISHAASVAMMKIEGDP